MIWLPVVGDYADIDVYASVLAYADLLNQRKKSARVYIPQAPNYSVPSELRLPERENAEFNLAPDDEVIILDISDPDTIHRFVPDEQILELIDHHFGYEKYWKRELGNRAIIEPIGAVATSIFEWWGECWDYAKMPKSIAKLLLAAILDNTLNFSAEITTARDHVAADKLAEIINVMLEDFTAWYFSEVSKIVMQDLESAVFADRKVKNGITFYQLALWNARVVLPMLPELIEKFNSASKAWFLNVISIEEGYNYAAASSERLDRYFADLLDLKESGEILISKRVHLRKEILKLMQESED